MAKYLFLFFFFCASFLSAENSGSSGVLSLRGYLGKEDIAKVSTQLDQFSKEGVNTLILEIDSMNGDLVQVLELAKKIYAFRKIKNHQVIVYIDDNAIGPAAIFPFLGDQIYISPFLAWGDIPLGSETVMAANLLRSRVVSFIDPTLRNAKLLEWLASAMADPTWVKSVPELKESAIPDLLRVGETLVLNQNQVQQLKIIQSVLTLDQFRNQFHLTTAQQEILQQSIQPETLAIPEKTLDSQLKSLIPVRKDGPNRVGWIAIDNRSAEINQGTFIYVKNALDYYKKNPPDFIILSLNTPGGEVFAAEKISDALKEMDTQLGIPVIAYIDNWAMSAGAMLAYSCRFIAVVKDGSMGAAEPVYAGEGGELKTASEKVNSALRADFANRARFFGRNPNIAEAMVDKDTILVLRHGRMIKLDNEQQIHLTGTDPDVLISPKGKLLTLNSEQLLSYGVADILVPPIRLEPMTEQEKQSGQWPASKIALFHTPFFNQIPDATIDVYQMDWKTQFFAFLSNPVVASLLFMGILLGFYMEMNTPGFGLAGTLAVTCLFLIMLSSFALEIANWLEVILLVVGFMVIIVELFVLPTFGLLGFIGIVLFLAGLFGMMVPGISSMHYEFDTKTWNAAGEVAFERLVWLSASMILAFVIMLILGRYVMPSFAGYNRLVLKGHEQGGYIAGEHPKDLPQPGSTGEVLSTLRPSGKVIIENKIFDAISDGSYIEKGVSIRVEKLDGSVIVVKEVKE